MTATPAYLRIADDIRRKIVSGEYAPGGQLPSHAKIQEHYGVSSTVARTVVAALKSEGLIEGRTGSGLYVRTVRRITRRSVRRNARGDSQTTTSPFARDAAVAGYQGRWEPRSEHAEAPEGIAIRLGINPGDPVMRTDYRFLADDEPIQMSTSWEPLAVTGGTPIEIPEEGPVVGVVARMDYIGVQIDEFVETVVARPARPDEIEQLALSLRGTTILAVARTYYAAGRPVETADIVFASDRYELEYRARVE